MAAILDQSIYSIRSKNGRFFKLSEARRRETVSENRKRNLSEIITEEEGGKAEIRPAKLLGRRIVELDVLSKELDGGCQSYGSPLKLSDCVQETVSGLRSYLYINCMDGECGEINLCHTNKTHRTNGSRGRKVFDVNTKLATG